jgi:long-subunit acyl-CoA synthetase (AMP-forming)
VFNKIYDGIYARMNGRWHQKKLFLCVESAKEAELSEKDDPTCSPTSVRNRRHAGVLKIREGFGGRLRGQTASDAEPDISGSSSTWHSDLRCYGMTETSPHTMKLPSAFKIGSVGRHPG